VPPISGGIGAVKRSVALKAAKPLVRRTPLRAGGPLQSRTELRRTSLTAQPAMRTAAPKAAGKPPAATKRTRYTGPDAVTVQAVWDRDLGRCAYCGDPITGERGWDWSVGHRRPRRAGGSKRPETNAASNLILLCGSGTTRCHGEVERERIAAVAAGFLLHAGDNPAAVAIEHAVHGRVWLTGDGGWTAESPAEVAA
jgi:5-methylcytosine-specific restriction endonuclease McrA